MRFWSHVCLSGHACRRTARRICVCICERLQRAEHGLWELTWHAGHMSSTGSWQSHNAKLSKCIEGVQLTTGDTLISMMPSRASPVLSPPVAPIRFKTMPLFCSFARPDREHDTLSKESPQRVFIVASFRPLSLSFCPPACLRSPCGFYMRDPCIAIWSTLGAATVICWQLLSPAYCAIR